jgi:RNA polymerase sigma-70 factor (ECF subfamily)
MDAFDPEWLAVVPETGTMDRAVAVPCRSGFASQMGRLYAENIGRLRSFLVRRMNRSSDAEDVAHEAFTRMLNRYDDGALENPVAMLYRIAINIVRDGARTERFQLRQCEGIVDPVCAAPPETDPESVCAARQRLRALKESIDNLPPRCREVFLLYRVGGKTHSEIARHLGISRNMVEKHIIRAYSQLRTATGADGDD